MLLRIIFCAKCIPTLRLAEVRMLYFFAPLSHGMILKVSSLTEAPFWLCLVPVWSNLGIENNLSRYPSLQGIGRQTQTPSSKDLFIPWPRLETCRRQLTCYVVSLSRYVSLRAVSFTFSRKVISKGNLQN